LKSISFIELETRCANLFGKEAALFVTSGTMGNLLAVFAHCPERGSEIIIGQKSHMHIWEQGNYAQFAGVTSTTLKNEHGNMLIKLKQCYATYVDCRWNN
jgi:threonine aldolase